MFCCSSKHFQLTIAKTQHDFDNPYLYHQTFKEQINKSGRSQGLLKHSSLKIDQNRGWEMKQGHDKQAQFWLQACDTFSKQVLLTKNNREDKDESVWRVLGKEQSHGLKIGDRIKLGFMQLLVGNMKIKEEHSVKYAQLLSQQHCRYCLLNSYTLDDPLLALCKCSGSVKSLHLGCLRRWLMMKMEYQSSNQIVIYTTEKFECQICKNPWPSQIYINGGTQALLSFDEEKTDSQEYIYEFSPFIVLQTLTLDENNAEVQVFIKVFVDRQFNIGDDENQSDLAFDQIGISPLHCSIRIQNGQFIIRDEGSRCGTLVTMHQQQNFTSKKSIFLQYKAFIMKIGRQSSFFDCLAPEEDCTMKFRVQCPKL